MRKLFQLVALIGLIAGCASAPRKITAFVKVRAYANPGLAQFGESGPSTFGIVVSDTGNKLISEQLKDDLWKELVGKGMLESATPKYTFVISSDEDYQVVRIPGISYSWPVTVTDRTSFSGTSFGSSNGDLGFNSFTGNYSGGAETSRTQIQQFKTRDQSLVSGC